MKNNEKEAEKRVDWFLSTFSPERFYLELQPADQQEQKILNEKLIALHTTKGIPLIATGDCHYPTAEDREAHEVMLSIQTHGKLQDEKRYTFGECRVHMRTTAEMLSEFHEYPEAIWNTGKIADRCNFEFPEGKLFFPKFAIPDTHTPETFFTSLCNAGFEKLKKNGKIPKEQEAAYADRLTVEIKLINTMKFASYFLIVSDFIQWARNNKIPVGPGRGSVAGSLVSWALEITNIDPIKYNLLFERFLNPERITMPDIDIDFCINGRDAVINYVRDKYGHEHVCQIITFGTLMAKGVIKDVARVLGFPFEDSNAITRLIPDQLKITLKEALQQQKELRDLVEVNPRAKKLFDIAFRLEGITRHASKHAAGVVISPEKIDTLLPIYVPPKSGELITQYAMSELESLGFLKIDLLGLKNLTLINKTVQLIKKDHNHDLIIDSIPLDDQKTFQLLVEGKTSGVFQLESSGIKEVLQKLQPEKFEDIIAVNALYRPGPLASGMVDDFIERKHGRQRIQYLFPELKPLLQETYGVIVYQEQVMKIASVIAGYTLGEADILRRAMGKKKMEVMATQRSLFLKRANEKKFNTVKAGQLFDLMAHFAGYGFNKSHSTAYAMLAYQTAYLKANYPVEFMACLVSLESTNNEKMAFYLQEAKTDNIDLLPPDINKSDIEFSVEDQKIRFGLQGIKAVGHVSLTNIIAERKKRPFNGLFDFCTRIDLRTSNKRVIEHLIAAGAFDTLAGNRAQQTNELGPIIAQAIDKKQEVATGQMGLFNRPKQSSNELEDNSYSYKPCKEWQNREKLEKEKDVIGFYLSSHPLHGHQKILKRLKYTSFEVARKIQQNNSSSKEISVTCCGVIKSRKDITTKRGDRMSFIQLEDFNSSAEIILFPKQFKNAEEWLDTETVFIVCGVLDNNETKRCKIKANLFIPINQILQQDGIIKSVTLTFARTPDKQTIQQLQNLLSPGKIPLFLSFQENDKNLLIRTRKKIKLDLAMIEIIESKRIAIECRL